MREMKYAETGFFGFDPPPSCSYTSTTELPNITKLVVQESVHATTAMQRDSALRPRHHIPAGPPHTTHEILLSALRSLMQHPRTQNRIERLR